MTATIGTPPTDPESAALELLVDAAEAATGSTAIRAVLQDLAGVLHVEEALSGLAWVDARLVAAAVSFDVCTAVDLRSDRCVAVPPRSAPAAARAASTPAASPRRSTSPQTCRSCDATAAIGVGSSADDRRSGGGKGR